MRGWLQRLTGAAWLVQDAGCAWTGRVGPGRLSGSDDTDAACLQPCRWRVALRRGVWPHQPAWRYAVAPRALLWGTETVEGLWWGGMCTAGPGSWSLCQAFYHLDPPRQPPPPHPAVSLLEGSPTPAHENQGPSPGLSRQTCKAHGAKAVAQLCLLHPVNVMGVCPLLGDRSPWGSPLWLYSVSLQVPPHPCRPPTGDKWA